MRKVLSTVALALAFMTTVASAQTPAPDPPSIVTHGTATLKRAPDRAWVSVSADARAAKAADARREAATQMTVVQAAIRAVGIPADAIKTTNYSLQPQMEWDGTRSRIRDYLAHNEIEVRVDNIDQLSDVIDAAGSVRTSTTLTVAISGIRFDLKNNASLVQETLGLAVKDAMAHAQAIAAGLGQALGPVIRVEEQPGNDMPRPPMPFARTMSAVQAQAVSTPIEPTEVEIRSAVTLTVRIR
jgi:uncharacterized protein